MAGGSISYKANMRRNTINPHGWLRGMISFALLIILWLILQNIIHFLALKHEKHQKLITITGSVFSCLIMFFNMVVLVLFWNKILYLHPYEDTIYLRNDPVSRIRITEGEDYDYEYNVRDEEYIDQLIRLLKSYKPSGQYSLLETIPFTYSFYELTFSYGDWKDNIDSTFLYVYEDEGTIYIDEPSYDIWIGDERIYDFIREYENKKETDEGTIFEIDRWFTYHGTYQISENYLEKEIICDRETGEDVTEWFLNTYQDAYEKGDYDTIWQALKQYRTEGRTIPLYPEEES